MQLPQGQRCLWLSPNVRSLSSLPPRGYCKIYSLHALCMSLQAISIAFFQQISLSLTACLQPAEEQIVLAKLHLPGPWIALEALLLSCESGLLHSQARRSWVYASTCASIPVLRTSQYIAHLPGHVCSPIVNRRKKDATEGKSADANAKKDEKKPAKKQAKKNKRGREPSAGTSVPVLLLRPSELHAELMPWHHCAQLPLACFAHWQAFAASLLHIHLCWCLFGPSLCCNALCTERMG